MKVVKNSILKKLLIILMLIIMSVNFIMPQYTYAETVGEKVVSGIFYLVAHLGDVRNKAYATINDWNIRYC